METAHAPAPHKAHDSRTTPKDFFLWLGVIIALYGSVTSLLTLLFQYINLAYPDPVLGGGDPYGTSIHVAMATIMVLVPTTLVLFYIIRNTGDRDPSRLHTWVRKWALVLTIFIASVTMLVDLITLITTFLGGEVTIRFIMKALIVLLAAAGIFLHFFADLTGYWNTERRRANIIGVAFGILALLTVLAGFAVIGSPAEARGYKLDQHRISDLQNIQYEITNYWQLTRELPLGLQALNDPLTGVSIPMDPESKTMYEYATTSPLSFSLCTTFSEPSRSGVDSTSNAYRYPGDTDQNFTHTAGHTCFTRTIDPSRYPVPVKS